MITTSVDVGGPCLVKAPYELFDEAWNANSLVSSSPAIVVARQNWLIVRRSKVQPARSETLDTTACSEAKAAIRIPEKSPLPDTQTNALLEGIDICQPCRTVIIDTYCRPPPSYCDRARRYLCNTRTVPPPNPDSFRHSYQPRRNTQARPPLQRYTSIGADKHSRPQGHRSCFHCMPRNRKR